MNDQFKEYISQELGMNNDSNVEYDKNSIESDLEEEEEINENENKKEEFLNINQKQIEIKNKIDDIQKIKILNNKKVKLTQKKYQILPLSRKREILLQLEPTKNNLKEIARINNVKTKTLQRWIKKGPERKRGGGRKIRDPIMDTALYQWYIDYHFILGNKVNVKLFKRKAMELSNDQHFRASKGWLEKYKKRYNISFN